MTAFLPAPQPGAARLRGLAAESHLVGARVVYFVTALRTITIGAYIEA
ncbi:hypothetical protein PXH67_43970 (plasmid) [Streptomyces sp. P8-A8]